MFSFLPPRETVINIGMITAIAVMVLLVIIEYRFTLRMVVAAAMSALCTVPGAVFGEIMRKLTYGEWLDMGSMIENFSTYEGTHYLGRVIYTILAAFLLWALVMRRKDGAFARAGRGRFLDILSVFMGIQAVAGRIGCLSEGCCVGRAHYGAFSVYNADLGHSVYPAVHTELVISALTLAAVVILYIKRRKAFPVFCIGYGTALFKAEFMYDSAGTVKIAGLSAIQILALALAAFGAIYS